MSGNFLKHVLGSATLRLACAVALAAAIVGAAPAMAQIANSATMAGTSLDTVVVTSSRTPERLREVTTNITVIDEQTIKISGANTLFDLMSQQGFKISTYGGASGSIQIRGFNTDDHGNDLGSHVLLLLDGRRILTGNSAMIALANVERIEIIRGPASAQFGASADGGVINVITRRGVGLPFSANVEAGGGSFDNFASKVKLGGSLDAFDFSLGASYDKRGDYKIPDGGTTFYGDYEAGTYDNTYYETFGLNLTAGYTFNETHRIGMVLNYVDYPDAGMPGDAAVPGQNHVGKTNYLIGLDYDGATSDNSLSWLLRLGYGRDRRDFWYVNDPDGNQDSFYDYTSKTVQAQVTWRHPMVTLTGGVDYLRYGMKAWGGVAAAKDGLYSNLGLFLIAKMRFFDDKLILSAAGRFDSFKMDVADLGVSKKETHFAPSVGVAFLPFEWLKLRANYANAFSMPTSDQLGADTVTGYGPTVGDPTLEPSESDTWEFGVDVMNEHANVSATYFYTKTDNYINFFYDMNVYVSTWRNLHVGYRSGVELYASADLAGMAGQNFELRPYFSMTHMFKFTGKETADDPYIPITGIPETVYGAGLRFSQADAGIAANVSVNKISNLNRLSPTSVNLSVIKRLFRVADYGEIYAKLVVDNFTDEKIEYNAGYVQPGRTIYLGVGYEY